MKDNLTEIILILDRSGSMCPLTRDTIGGFNSFIENQKKVDGEAKITTVLFNEEYKLLHDGVDINDISPLTETEYITGGMTALYDAVGKTINNVGVRLSGTAEEERPSKVIVVIITDGEENSSREFTKDKVKEMITHQTEKYNWEFVFLGANIDSASVGSGIGISVDRSIDYAASSKGVESVYCALDCALSDYRSTGSISAESLNSIL